MARLLRHEPDGTRIRYTLGPGTTLIGRSDRCDIALDGDDRVSRTHCLLQRRGTDWVLRDRGSRHGTTVDGERVDQAVLRDGAVIGLGGVTLTFEAGERHGRAETSTATRAVRTHEDLVDAGERAVTATALLRIDGGPRTGESLPLDRPTVTLGGPGSRHVLDDDLPRKALTLHIHRGRVVADPSGRATVMIAGAPLRGLMPVLEGEAIEIGEHRLVVERSLSESTPLADRFGAMVGSTPVMHELFGVLARLAVHDQPVLLLGESGTGKELAAQALHDEGSRADGPFVVRNCAALETELVGSELFGHEKGAFTGADRRRDGAFHEADGGTLFLDEIGELPLDVQARLLRVLESGEVRRVGGNERSWPDVRIVAATHRDLGGMVAEGRFRGDLLFRLQVLPVRLPPLRERLDDLPALCRVLLEGVDRSATLTPQAMERLRGHRWPGNVRELRNVLHRAVILGGPEVHPEAITFSADAFGGSSFVAEPRHDEASVIRQALQQAGGNRSAAARSLGMPRSTLLYKMRRWGLS